MPPTPTPPRKRRKTSDKRKSTTAAAAAATAASPTASTEDCYKRVPVFPILTDAGDAAPSDWSPTDPAAFEYFFFRMLAFKQRYKSFDELNADRHPVLYAWLLFARRGYHKWNNYCITPQQQAESVWTAEHWQLLETHELPLLTPSELEWENYFNEIVKFKQLHGHTVVPCGYKDVKGLRAWMTEQHYEYEVLSQKRSSTNNSPTPKSYSRLTPGRRKRLDDIGFNWKRIPRNEWEKQYDKLLQYKERFGDCVVPQHWSEDRKLGKWVAKQREHFTLRERGERNTITAERIEKLNAIGFVWKLKTLPSRRRTKTVETTESEPTNEVTPPQAASPPRPQYVVDPKITVPEHNTMGAATIDVDPKELDYSVRQFYTNNEIPPASPAITITSNKAASAFGELDTTQI